MSYLFGRTLMSSWDLYEWLCKTCLSNTNKTLFNSFECTVCKKTTGNPGPIADWSRSGCVEAGSPKFESRRR